jgi:hypothetical protein
VDQKIKMQNAADAATHAGGVVLARSMNTLAFTNHLLCEAFALTAFLREAQARTAESLTPEILAHWELVAPLFEPSDYPKFAALGPAILQKAPLERELVRAYGDWAAAAAEIMLPMMEWVLDGDSAAVSDRRPIPEFQRALVRATPQMVQAAVDEVARRHGVAWPNRARLVTRQDEGDSPYETRLRGVLWRTTTPDPVGGMSESQRRTLPVVDPDPSAGDMEAGQAEYFATAREQRCVAARSYMELWCEDLLIAFDHFGKMSRYSQLLRALTRSRLRRLLNDEYYDTNLPHLIRTPRDQMAGLDVNAHLEQDFMFVGVVYRQKLETEAGASQTWMSRVFNNPVDFDTLAYAQTMLFVPRPRLRYYWPGEALPPLIGGVPGDVLDDPEPPEEEEQEEEGEEDEEDEPPPAGDGVEQSRPPQQEVTREHWVSSWCSPRWDLMNQNWTTQLVPATTDSLLSILSTQPSGDGASDLRIPDLFNGGMGLSQDDIQRVSQH